MGPGGRRNCWARGRVWGKIRRPSSAHPLLLSSWAPKPGPRLTSVRKPSRTSRELPHAGVYVCLCVCRCLGGKYSLHLTRAPVGRTMSPLSVQAGTWEDRASNQGFWGWAISFPLSLVGGGRSRGTSWCCFLPSAEGQGYSPGCVGSSGAGLGATRAL